METLIDDVRAQRQEMLRYMVAHRHPTSGLPGMHSYRLVCAFIETLEHLQAGNVPGARRSISQWEAWATKLLDAQLFSAAPNNHAISMGEAALHGADGCTYRLGEMLREQRAVMEACIAAEVA